VSLLDTSFEALLTDSRAVTGRDRHGEIVDDNHLVTWLGAVGYVCFIDQVGKVFDFGMIRKGTNTFEKALLAMSMELTLSARGGWQDRTCPYA
jgi:hypothetical protein